MFPSISELLVIPYMMPVIMLLRLFFQWRTWRSMVFQASVRVHEERTVFCSTPKGLLWGRRETSTLFHARMPTCPIGLERTGRRGNRSTPKSLFHKGARSVLCQFAFLVVIGKSMHSFQMFKLSSLFIRIEAKPQ